jgi:hypothetical protein
MIDRFLAILRHSDTRLRAGVKSAPRRAPLEAAKSPALTPL